MRVSRLATLVGAIERAVTRARREATTLGAMNTLLAVTTLFSMARAFFPSDALRIDWSPTLPSTTEVTFEIDAEWKLESGALLDDAAPAWDLTRQYGGRLIEHRRLRWRETLTSIDGEHACSGEREFLEAGLVRSAVGATVSAGETDRELACDANAIPGGARVAFRWNAEERAYEVESLGETPLDPHERSRMTFGADFGELAVGRAVAPGQTWWCDARVLVEVLEPGGAFQFREDGRDAVRPWLSRDVAASREGELRVELVQVREDASSRLAQLQVTGKTMLERDRSADLSAHAACFFFGPPARSTITERIQLELAGEVLWDVDRARARSLDLRLAVRREQVAQAWFYGNDPLTFEIVWRGAQRLRGEWRSLDDVTGADANADDDEALR
jgi:hypothetical protein